MVRPADAEAAVDDAALEAAPRRVEDVMAIAEQLVKGEPLYTLTTEELAILTVRRSIEGFIARIAAIDVDLAPLTDTRARVVSQLEGARTELDALLRPQEG